MQECIPLINTVVINTSYFKLFCKLPRFLTKAMSLKEFARSKGLGSYELSLGVMDKRSQKAEGLHCAYTGSVGHLGKRN